MFDATIWTPSLALSDSSEFIQKPTFPWQLGSSQEHYFFSLASLSFAGNCGEHHTGEIEALRACVCVRARACVCHSVLH